MEIKIAVIVEKTKQSVIKHIVNKSIEDMRHSKNPLEKMCLQRKTPDGIILEPCIFHSYTKKDNKTSYDKCLEGINNYAFCTEDFQVYDICNHLERKIQEKNLAKSRRMMDDMYNYNKQMNSINQIHGDFSINYEKRRVLIQEKKNLEKSIGKVSLDYTEDADYQILKQILEKAEEIFENTKLNLSKVYALKPYDITLEDFIGKFSKEDSLRVDRAKNSLQTWCNKRENGSFTKDQERMISLDAKINSMTKLLASTFEIPCAFLYKAIEKIEKLYHYFKKDKSYQNDIQEMERDLEKLKVQFEIYKEFMGDKDIEVIIYKVDKEQRQALEIEKSIKSRKNIQKVENISKNAMVIKLDGTVEKDTNENRLVIGSVIEAGPVQDDNWRFVRS